MRLNVDPALQGILALRQFDGGTPAPKQLPKQGPEADPHLVEGLLKKQTCGLIDFTDRLLQLRFCRDQIPLLRLEKRKTVFQLLILGNRLRIHGPHFVHLLLQGFRLLLQLGPLLLRLRQPIPLQLCFHQRSGVIPLQPLRKSLSLKIKVGTLDSQLRKLVFCLFRNLSPMGDLRLLLGQQGNLGITGLLKAGG